VLHACEREAQRARSASAAEWTPDLIDRVLTVFRIAGAVALGGPVAETLVERRERPREGQLAVEIGGWPRRRLLMSAPTTAAAIAARLTSDRHDLASPGGEVLEDIAALLHLFGAAYYGRGLPLDIEALDTALDRGMRGLHRLRVATSWPVRAADMLARTAAALREAIWAR
jgi:hypothetical protein